MELLYILKGLIEKLAPFLLTYHWGKSKGRDNEIKKQNKATISKYKKANNIKGRKLLTVSAVIKRLRNDKQ